MAILDRYLLRLFFAHFVILLVGLTAFLGILDLLLNADKVLVAENGGALALFRYTGLRLPEIVSRIMPFSVLIAVMLMLARLIRHSEIIALMVAGISQFRLILALMPAALLVAGAQFLLDDRLVPAGIEALRDWGVGEYTQSTGDGTAAKFWARDGNIVVRVRAVGADGDVLDDVVLFRRDQNGKLVERLEAATARYENGDWMLEDVIRLRIDDNEVTRAARVPWKSSLQPALFSSLSKHPRELSLMEVKRFVDQPEIAGRPAYFYETWFNEKLATPTASILMILLAVALTHRIHQRQSSALMLAAGIAVGFLYFVIDGVTLSSGEAGLLAPAVAAWVPTLIFASIGAAIAFHAEHR